MGRPAKEIDQSTYSGRFAVRLRTLREKAGLTIDDVAERITQTGYQCTSRTVYRWEDGSRFPSVDMLPEIAKALGESIRNLFPAS
ncbi:Helix-turn-helix domain protein [Pirellula sp. SH-Sr6A]|nr:Helix-turn-helix domain protein [Pirellula sp. SH-Sr6A]